MAVGIGFSVGDIFTSFQLIKDSIEAIKDTKGASADYAALLTEIKCLRDGLEAIKDLQLDRNGSHKQQEAISRATRACQQSIDEFLSSISKYQRHLHSSASGLTSIYRKVKWVLCRKDDVTAFRARLQRHTSSIILLLITFRAKKRVGSEDEENSTSSNGKTRDEIRNGRTSALLKDLFIEQRQCFEFLMHQNQELLRNVQDRDQMLRMQRAIPTQNLHQQEAQEERNSQVRGEGSRKRASVARRARGSRGRGGGVRAVDAGREKKVEMWRMRGVRRARKKLKATRG